MQSTQPKYTRRLDNERRDGKPVCAVEGCDRLGRGRYCGAHATRLKKYGDVGSPQIRRMAPAGMSPHDRIDLIGWTVTPSGCWEWNGRRDDSVRGQYGRLDDLRGIPVRAHRVAYEKWIGPIPDGLVVMHSCDNPPCINPGHLSLGTVADNLGEMADKGRARNQQLTHCKRGHEFTPENTMARPNRNGRVGRKCLACETLRNERYARERALKQALANAVPPKEDK